MNQITTGKGTVLSKAEAGYREPDHRYPCVMCRRLRACIRRGLWIGSPAIGPKILRGEMADGHSA